MNSHAADLAACEFFFYIRRGCANFAGS